MADRNSRRRPIPAPLIARPMHCIWDDWAIQRRVDGVPFAQTKSPTGGPMSSHNGALTPRTPPSFKARCRARRRSVQPARTRCRWGRLLPGKFDPRHRRPVARRTGPQPRLPSRAIGSDSLNYPTFRHPHTDYSPTQGSACPPEVKRRLHAWAGADRAWEFYGSTEGQFSACVGTDWESRPGTLGRARRVANSSSTTVSFGVRRRVLEVRVLA